MYFSCFLLLCCYSHHHSSLFLEFLMKNCFNLYSSQSQNSMANYLFSHMLKDCFHSIFQQYFQLLPYSTFKNSLPFLLFQNLINLLLFRLDTMSTQEQMYQTTFSIDFLLIISSFFIILIFFALTTADFQPQHLNNLMIFGSNTFFTIQVFDIQGATMVQS